MESFTKDMFNRIIDFQEKEHHAWNTNLSFNARIKGLPLHNLIFSNPDRNPATHGSTVAAFFPLREEMQKIAFYVRQLADKPVVCDIYPGNGFIGSLLGREIAMGSSSTEAPAVIGQANDPTEIKPNQIESFFDAEHFAHHDEPLMSLASMPHWFHGLRRTTTQVPNWYCAKPSSSFIFSPNMSMKKHNSAKQAVKKC